MKVIEMVRIFHFSFLLLLSSVQHSDAQDIFSDCDVCPQMITIPAGNFAMGSNRFPSEMPITKIQISSRFAVGKFEVTFDEWDACVAEAGCVARKTRKDHGWGKANRPVIYVTWNDAVAYTNWLNTKTEGNAYRLLSEAEWEYVARAGAKNGDNFSWGEKIDCSRANYGKRPGSECNLNKTGNPGTLPVGTFAPNLFGLYDLHGNVWEWVQDCWHVNYSSLPNKTAQTASAWENTECTFRVIRGGSWLNHATRLRISNRSRLGAANRDFNFGFRVAKTLR